MKDYIYYTPPKIARELLTLVPKRNYETIVDICCGSWNLLNAAWEMFPNAKFTGVDVKKSPCRVILITPSFITGMDEILP